MQYGPCRSLHLNPGGEYAKHRAMSIWTILSWVGLAVLTAVNVVVFLKLKQAAEQMMKVAFPGAKNMQDAVARMQAQMGGMRGNKDAQLRQAMEMLQNLNKKR
ncbi:MAG: hypothetical protein KGQ59_07590 [Bdellovibrionales bacterium]|nr:hypothetical protein [Bdellovibrionales bacterium]